MGHCFVSGDQQTIDADIKKKLYILQYLWQFSKTASEWKGLEH